MNAIHAKMTIKELLHSHPEVAKVLARYNLGCIGCMGAAHETIEAGATAHGIDPEALLRDLNSAVKTRN